MFGALYFYERSIKIRNIKALAKALSIECVTNCWYMDVCLRKAIIISPVRSVVIAFTYSASGPGSIPTMAD